MSRVDFVPLASLFESESDSGVEGGGANKKLFDAIDAQIQRRMGDISKLREMYTDIVKEVGDDGDETKKAFLDRIGNMIHSSEEGQEGDKSENGFRVPSKV
jgi:hypothetical protein